MQPHTSGRIKDINVIMTSTGDKHASLLHRNGKPTRSLNADGVQGPAGLRVEYGDTGSAGYEGPPGQFIHSHFARPLPKRSALEQSSRFRINDAN